MLIRLSPEQQEQVLTWSGKNTRAEMEAGSEASGYELIVEISPYATTARAVWNGQEIELGDVEVVIE